MFSKRRIKEDPFLEVDLSLCWICMSEGAISHLAALFNFCIAPSLNTLLGTTADLQTKEHSEVTIVTTLVPEVKHEVDVVTTEEGIVENWL